MEIVIVNCFETYENRVALLQDFFEKTGDKVKVYTADYCHFKKCKRETAPDNYILIKTRPYKKNLSFERLSSHADFAKKVYAALEERIEQTDLIWVMLPPNSLARRMGEIKQKFPAVRLVFDVIDMWPETMPLHGVDNIWPLSKWKKLRNKNLKFADAVVTECYLYHEKIKDYVTKDKLFNLYFAKKHTDFPKITEKKTECMELCYLGSINNIIDIDLIGKIIEQVSKERTVKLHVVGDGERKEALLETARLAGAEVEYHGIVFDEEQKSDILARCHFGLNIMKDSVYVGLTMKSMDYFAAGLPMINNIKGDTGEIVARNGFGVNYPFETDELLKIYERKEVRAEIRAFYEAHFSVEAFEEGLRGIMEKLNANRN